MIIKRTLTLLIRFYQEVISKNTPTTCRFYPSCSEYSLQSLEKFGIIKGLYKSFKRILKCHPFHAGGYDPVEQ